MCCKQPLHAFAREHIRGIRSENGGLPASPRSEASEGRARQIPRQRFSPRFLLWRCTLCGVRHTKAMNGAFSVPPAPHNSVSRSRSVYTGRPVAAQPSRTHMSSRAAGQHSVYSALAKVRAKIPPKEADHLLDLIITLSRVSEEGVVATSFVVISLD